MVFLQRGKRTDAWLRRESGLADQFSRFGRPRSFSRRFSIQWWNKLGLQYVYGFLPKGIVVVLEMQFSLSDKLEDRQTTGKRVFSVWCSWHFRLDPLAPAEFKARTRCEG